jgi:hypothetical protein
MLGRASAIPGGNGAGTNAVRAAQPPLVAGTVQQGQGERATGAHHGRGQQEGVFVHVQAEVGAALGGEVDQAVAPPGAQVP